MALKNKARKAKRKNKLAEVNCPITKEEIPKVQNTKTGQFKKLKKGKGFKFTLDHKGSSRPQGLAKTDDNPGRVLGIDPLAKKERELLSDLFGDDGEPVEDTGREVCSELDVEESCSEVTVKAKDAGRKRPSMIPDDPHDIYQDEQPQKRAAWIDEEDQTIKVKDKVAGMSKARGTREEREVSDELYSHTIQNKFNQTIGGTPGWARLKHHGTEDEEEEEEEDDSLVKGTADYLAHGKSAKLPKKWLDYKQQNDLNKASYNEGALIKAIEFNQYHHVALVAGCSREMGAASLFQVDGTHNHLIHSVKFHKFPITYAMFLADGKSFLVGTNHGKHFFTYDLEASKEMKVPANLGQGHNIKKGVVSPDGKLLVFISKNTQLHIFDTHCLAHVDTLQASGDVCAAAFNASGSRLYTHSHEGDILIWDMHTRSCLRRFYDEGSIGGTSIAVSPNNQYLACGSSSGIVNVYDLASTLSPNPLPVKGLDHLRTSATHLTFNSSSEILATVSTEMDNAIKLVHLPSLTYFENFPYQRRDLRRVNVASFSPQSGFLALGNNRACAPLYQLQHFVNY